MDEIKRNYGLSDEYVWLECDGVKVPPIKTADNVPEVPTSEQIANDYHDTLQNFVEWLRNKPAHWAKCADADFLATAYMAGE